MLFRVGLEDGGGRNFVVVLCSYKQDHDASCFNVEIPNICILIYCFLLYLLCSIWELAAFVKS